MNSTQKTVVMLIVVLMSAVFSNCYGECSVFQCWVSQCHKAGWCHAECNFIILSIISLIFTMLSLEMLSFVMQGAKMLSFTILNVIMISVFMLSATVLRASMLSVILLSVIMQSVIILSVPILRVIMWSVTMQCSGITSFVWYCLNIIVWNKLAY